MRACIFTTELGTVAARKEALLTRLAELTGAQTFDEAYFIGFLESQPLGDGIAGYHPYLGDALKRRVAQRGLRFVDEHHWVPILAAGPMVNAAASMVAEALLACDPDAVLLDVRWGRQFQDVFQREFAGPVFVQDELRSGAQRKSARWRRYDADASVSIVLPTRNGTRYIRQSVESCLVQTHRNLELIVVDDGSTEDMRRAIGDFADPRLRYVRHEKNQGVSAALNTGFRMASGDYLTWTSDDNYYAPHAIERLLSFLQTYPSVDFAYSSSYIIDEMGPGNTLRLVSPQPPEYLARHNGVGACFLYTRRVYEAIGDYNAKAFLVEDYDYWVRVSRAFRMQRLFAPLYYYRYHEKSLTSQHSREEVARRFDVVKQQHGIA